MKILLVGNGTRHNRGCEALSITTITLLKEVYPHCEIKILSFDTSIDEYYNSIYGTEVIPIWNDCNYDTMLFWRILNKLDLLPIKSLSKYTHLVNYYNELSSASLVLSIGGDNYSDDYSTGEFFWNLARLANKCKVPFVIWGGSVGPFNKKKSINNARAGLKAVSLITARENITIDYLKKFGYGGRIVRVYDTAFKLKSKTVDMPLFSRNKEIIGFNISPLYSRFTNYNSKDILKICYEFLNEVSTNYNILLIPHVMFPDPDNNDWEYMKYLSENLQNAHLVSAEYNSQELKYIISNCSFFIGARTHATIAAFSSGIPTLSLGYSIKAKGLNLDLFDSDEFLLDSLDFCGSTLMSKFMYLVKNRDICINKLSSANAKIDKSVAVGIDSLFPLLHMK